MPTNVPIVTCGNNKPDAVGVHAGMQPDYEVIYAGFSLPETLEELPVLLAGKSLPADSLHTQIASNNFSRRLVAIVCGGGYDDKAFENLRDACIAACGSKADQGAAFFRADNALTDRLVAEGKGPAKRTAGYAQAVAQRLKNRLGEVVGDGKLRKEDAFELFLF